LKVKKLSRNYYFPSFFLSFVIDTLALLYAFIKCLRAGVHQIILPNRRTVKIHQQTMDFLHRVGEATVLGFAEMTCAQELPTKLNIGDENRTPDVTRDRDDRYFSMHSLPPMSSDVSLSSTMTYAIEWSSANFNNDELGLSFVPYGRLDPERQKTIKSFKTGVKVQLRKMIRKHCQQWEKGMEKVPV
jgi:hypothetical protein